MENNFIYLDNASTTPLSENVLNIINSTYRNYWHNPSSRYELGIKCSTYLEKIRSKIAYIFEADPEDIILHLVLRNRQILYLIIFMKTLKMVELLFRMLNIKQQLFVLIN